MRRSCSRSALSARALTLAAALPTMLILASCASTTPIPADQALSHYDDAAASIAASLEDLGGPWSHDDGSRRVAEDDGCRYSPGRWDAPGPLDGVSAGDGWDPVVDAAQGPAEKAGFGDFSRPQRRGAMYAVEATDGHGATLRIDGQGTITISGARVDADQCTGAALGF